MSPQLEPISEAELPDFFEEELLDLARELVRFGAVRNLVVDPHGDEVKATVYDGGHPYYPEFTRSQNQLYASCNCLTAQTGMCEHMAALMLVWSRGIPSHGEMAGFSSDEDEEEDDLDLLEEFLQPLDGLHEPPIDLLESISPEDFVQDYRKLLNQLTVPKLRELASRRNIALSGNRRDPILDALAQGLSEAENIKSAIEILSAPARLALDLMIAFGSVQQFSFQDSVNQFLEKALKIRRLEHSEGSADLPRANSEVCLTELSEFGLAFLEGGRVSIPASVHKYLPPDPQWLPPFGGKLAQIRSPSPIEFTRLAVRLLLLAQAGEMKVRPEPHKRDWSGWPSSQEVDRFSPTAFSQQHIVPAAQPYLAGESLKHLAGEINQPPEKVDYLARLLGAGGLWKPAERQSLAVQSENLVGFLALDPPSQTRFLFQIGQNLWSWTEMDMARANQEFTLMRMTYYSGSYDAYLEARVYARQALMRCLSLAPVGTWVGVEYLLRLIHSQSIDFNPRNPTQGLWLERGGKKVDPRKFESWRESYGLFYTAILSGPAQWMGICDTAWEGSRLVACRLTRLGAYLLGQSESFESPKEQSAEASLVFLSGMDVALDPARATPAILSLIPLLGKLRPQKAGDSGRVMGGIASPGRQYLHYRLTPEGATRLFELGWTPQRVLEILESAALTPPPVEIAQRLHAWWDSYGRLHIYANMALMEFSDDFCLTELLAGTSLSRYLLYVFNPRLVAVRPEGVGELLANLEASGYTPRVNGMEAKGA